MVLHPIGFRSWLWIAKRTYELRVENLFLVNLYNSLKYCIGKNF